MTKASKIQLHIMYVLKCMAILAVVSLSTKGDDALALPNNSEDGQSGPNRRQQDALRHEQGDDRPQMENNFESWPQGCDARRTSDVSSRGELPESAAEWPVTRTGGAASAGTAGVLWAPKEVECNLVFVKIPKSGSSTNAGVAYRIAQRRGLQLAVPAPGQDAALWDLGQQQKGCRVYAVHVHASALGPVLLERSTGERRPDSFLYTVVREPAARALSHYFWTEVGVAGDLPSDEAALAFLRRPEQANMAADFMELAPYSRADPAAYAEAVLGDYDFIGVLERQAESLLVLKHLLSLSLAEVLFFSLKVAGNDEAPRSTAPFRSPVVQAFLESDFLPLAALDRAIHAAANAALDRYITAYGTTRFKAELGEYEALLGRAHRECAHARGQGCIYRDQGCGYACFEALLSARGGA